MKKTFSLLLLLLLLVGCATVTEEDKKQTAIDNTTEIKDENENIQSFKNGKLILNDLELTITSSEVVESEYGEDTLIVFRYELLNKNADDLTMVAANFLFEAYQDNDPNIENKLEWDLPPKEYNDIRNQKIKKGGTINGAMAFVLTDTTTDVELKAFVGFVEYVGTTVYEIKK